MKKIIFMGKTGCGKTTLCQRLEQLEIKYKKTQSVELYKDAIDTPGEYIENRWFYNSLFTTSADAKVVAIVYDATQAQNFIAPGFGSRFCKEVIGIITKISIATEDQIKLAHQILDTVGVDRRFEVDAIDNIGLEPLFEYLKDV